MGGETSINKPTTGKGASMTGTPINPASYKMVGNYCVTETLLVFRQNLAGTMVLTELVFTFLFVSLVPSGPPFPI